LYLPKHKQKYVCPIHILPLVFHQK